jgi:hypothetical protein
MLDCSTCTSLAMQDLRSLEFTPVSSKQCKWGLREKYSVGLSLVVTVDVFLLAWVVHTQQQELEQRGHG